MNPPSIQLGPPRQRRKRHGAVVGPPAGVTVVSVTALGGQRVLWTFSAPVLTLDVPTGLLIYGQAADFVEEITPEGGAIIWYSDEIVVGAPWDVSSEVEIVISFDGGGTLAAPETGTVVV